MFAIKSPDKYWKGGSPVYEHELLREGSAVRGKGCAKKIKTQKRKLCLHYFIIHIMMDWNNVVLL